MSQVPTVEVPVRITAGDPTTPEPPKAGVKTSEFWLTVMGKATGLGLIVYGAYTKQTEIIVLGSIVGGVALGTYNLSRGLAKG